MPEKHAEMGRRLVRGFPTAPPDARRAIVGLSIPKGARTLVYLASSPEVEGISGEYFSKCKVTRTAPRGRDDEAAERLWSEFLRLLGIPEK